ncbi:MAG: 50S ribosomal protein L35 [Patescibacteria group bacterium]
MPKLKTKKVISKRIKKSKRKYMLVACGQDHFNARQSGKNRRNKRRNNSLHKSLLHNVKKALGE